MVVTATDNVGTPYAGRPLVYSIGGANPKTGTVTTNSAGVATISYAGTKAGLDTIQMFLDLAGTGIQASQDPASAAQVTWLPNSGYTIRSVKANPDGTITITFVPAEEGRGDGRGDRADSLHRRAGRNAKKARPASRANAVRSTPSQAA